MPNRSGRNRVICSITLNKITRNPEQPRTDFPPDYIKTLAASINQRGLIQPITVRRVGKELLETGTYASLLDGAVPFTELNAMLDRREP